MQISAKAVERNLVMLKRVLYALVIGSLLSCSTLAGNNEVTVKSRKIMVGKEQYIIRGICYSPVPKGSRERSFETLTEDLALMVEANINTIRVYSPIDDKAVLDEIDAAGLKVIIGFGYNQDGYYDILSGSFIDYINQYKDHPAILMWEFGNEYNYHPEWFGGDMMVWYKALNEATQLAHEADSSHPVATAHGELPDDTALSSCPDVDVWGLNVYRWDHPNNEEANLFEQWAEISSKPMYVSESGGDSYMTIESHGYAQGENQKAQADANGNILTAVFENQKVCSGITLFSFADGWWKAGSPRTQDAGGWAPHSNGVPYDGAPNEEYWGIVDIDRNPKEAFSVVKEIYDEFAD